MSPPGEPVPPQDLDAERAVLGAMLISRDAVDFAAETLPPDAFYRVAHQKVFAAIVAVGVTRRERVDLVTLAEELRRRGDLESVGGLVVLAALVESVASTAGLQEHLRIVQDKSILRRLQVAAFGIQRGCTEASDDVRTILDRAESAVMAVRESQVETVPNEPVGLVLSRVVSGSRRGIPTGFGKLDWATGGLHAGQLITVASRPGVGKTAWGCGLADRLAFEGHTVQFFTLEMDPQEIASRFIAFRGIPLKDVYRGGPEVERAAMQIKNLPLNLWHKVAPTILDLRAVLRRAKPKIDVVIVDYLQLIAPGQRVNSPREAVTIAVRGAKAMATEFGIPVVGLAQLNREIEKDGKIRKPMLSDLKESAALEETSDTVVLLHRAQYYTPDSTDADMIVAKNRLGPVTGGKLVFVGKYARYEDPIPDTAIPQPRREDERDW